jgi:hypothetical protein
MARFLHAPPYPQQPCPLDMGKVDQEIGIVDQSGDIDMLERAVFHFLGVVILFKIPAPVQDGTSQDILAVPADLRLPLGDVVVGDEAVTARGFDKSDKLADKNRRDGAVADIAAHMHLDGDGFALDLCRKPALLEHTVESGRQSLVGVICIKGVGRKKDG